MPAISKEQTIAEIVQQHPYSVPVFLRHGLFCFGCAVARYENLEQGAMAHGIDPEVLLADLNKAAEENATQTPATAE
ncbi:MAG: DUF1858 domain-containing protein [Chloroflexota bacterium]